MFEFKPLLVEVRNSKTGEVKFVDTVEYLTKYVSNEDWYYVEK